MKKMWIFPAILFFFGAGAVHCFAGDSQGRAAIEESAQAVSHAGKSSAHAVCASGQAVVGVAAVPLGVVAVAGVAGAGMAEGLMRAATDSACPGCSAFPVSDEIVTAGPPPNEALNSAAKQGKE